jgi:exodeoxyribonuclease VII large subunit
LQPLRSALVADQLPLAVGPEARTWSVTELGAELQRLLQAAYPAEIWVRGELRNLRPSARGGTRNLFFDLVEPGAGLHGKPAAALRVVLWDEQRRSVNATLTADGPAVKMDEGVEVRIRGRLQWWGRQGDLRFQMQAIDPVYTLGRLTADRERLLADLDARGLLRANAGRPMPPVPLRVGLVTARDSAAEADVLHELGTSGIGFHVLAADSLVQGPSAPAALVRALAAVSQRAVQVVVVARGGGSRTDLACFDHPDVARAIATCPVPVITGIGHEIDRSVADEVAHTAAKTPTAAAASLVARVREVHDQLDGRWAAVAGAVVHHLAAERRTIDVAAERAARRVASSLDRARERCRDRERTLTSVATSGLGRRAERLDQLERHLRALDPDRLLARGWSITRTADGRTVRSLADVGDGDLLRTTVADGELLSRAVPTSGADDG